ncbi:MAG TPA: discoidin domain-containing protein, partial [Phycisphaerales bacterium]|nr:discoidin domain-containing protein [Phycisphaerales bacterium]
MQCLRLTAVILSMLLAGTCALGGPQAAGEPAAAAGEQPATGVLDVMDNAASWKIVTPEGVRLSLHEDDGHSGRCLRLDYEFVTGGGYCIIQKDFPVTLPSNYEFAFHVRGDGPDNNLEFKLLDRSGDSVWWVNRRAYEWPSAWTRLSNKKRKLEFAWGPSGGAPLTEISKIEFAIASSGGGKGSVWLDELVLRELADNPERRAQAVAQAVSSNATAQSAAALAVDGLMESKWTSGTEAEPTLVIDLGSQREFGGVRVDWDAETRGYLRACEVSVSDDAVVWLPLGEPRPIHSARSLFVTPDAESRYVRIRCVRAVFDRENSRKRQIGVREVTVLPPEFSATSNSVFESLARESTPGMYPKYFRGEAGYWTVIGEHSLASDARLSYEEAMINEEGQVEVGKRHFSIEPFIRPLGGKILTWADATHTQSVVASGIPLPVVTRTMENLSLETTAWTEQNYGVPWLMLRYRLTNTSRSPHSGSLALAVRPFQVNPMYQWLNTPGGFAPIRSVTRMEHADNERSGTTLGVRVSSGRVSRDVLAISRVSEVAFVRSDDADVVTAMHEGQLRGGSGASSLTDTAGTLSVLFKYAYDLSPGAVHECVLAVPLHDSSSLPLLPVTPYANPELTQQSLDRAVRQWHEATSGTAITVPQADQWLADTFAAQLAYILINRDGPALQPGSRSYERSWARDGSLTSAALLACGHAAEAKAWIDWFGSHQFENGKIPCVVDSRGPDPVNEHDSHGEYIWAVANYYRHTHD